MTAKLRGLDGIDWTRTHPNGDPAEIPRQLRRWALGQGFEANPREAPPDVLGDLLVHQETRFDGGAQALPFLVELALEPDTRARATLVQLASAIGAPVEHDSQGVEIDRAAIAALSDEELFSGTFPELSAAYLVMCEVDGRNAWLEELHRLSPLVEDGDPDVQRVAIAALASEATVPVEHEARLLRVMKADGDLGWRGTLALGLLGEARGLQALTLEDLRQRLEHEDLVQRVTAACALALAGAATPEARSLLDADGALIARLAHEQGFFWYELTSIPARLPGAKTARGFRRT